MRALVALLLLLAAAAPAAAQRPRSARDDGGFDYFLLSLSLAPSFCALSSRNAGNPECRDLTEAVFQETPLTIHGLWPNRARMSSNLQPQACSTAPFAISDALQARLQRLMPGGPGLARYEWRKHGTCSGLDPERFFGAAAALAEGANQTIGAALLRLRSPVRIGDLLRDVGAEHPDLAPAIVVSCRFGRGGGGGGAMIEEIRVTLDKQFRPIPAASVGLGQNSGCPGGAGRIPPIGR